MKELLTYIVQSLVEKPDEVSVTEHEAGGETVFEVRVAPGDMGKVIGRQGRVVKENAYAKPRPQGRGAAPSLRFLYFGGYRMAKEPYLEAGKIINTFGVRGEVKLDPWCDSAEFLKPLKTLYIDGAPRTVASSRVHKGMLIVRFADVEDVNGAMLLKNKIAYFARGDVRLPKGRHFIADLLGASVVDEQGAEIGRLTEVLDLPASQVYVVQGETEHTIPAVPEFILDIDADEKLIRVHLIEGM